MKSKTAIVYGGAGFIGSHVADSLTEKGYHVKIFDLHKSPYLQEDQEMIVGDILDRKSVDEAMRDCDLAFNFAAIANIDEAAEKPIETIETNVLGNTYVLSSCVHHQVSRYIFSSSVYVYSDTGSFYRASKQACETIIKDFHSKFGLDYNILRYGSIYGPRAPETNGIYKIVKQALTEGKITRHGDGKEIRDYIHVKDAAEITMGILAEECKNKIFILTGNSSLRIKDLYIMLKEILGNRVDLEFLDSVNSYHYEITPYSFKPDVAKKITKNEYYDLGQGLLECVNEVHSQLKDNNIETIGF